MQASDHAIEVCHAANGLSPIAVYARCTCEWESDRWQLTGTELDGQDVAVMAVEVEGVRHVEQATSPRI